MRSGFVLETSSVNPDEITVLSVVGRYKSFQVGVSDTLRRQPSTKNAWFPWFRTSRQKYNLLYSGAGRWPVMTVEEFAVNVLDTNILTSDEVVTFFKYFAVPTSPSPVAFCKTPRGKLTHAADYITSCRFTSCTPTSWNYYPGAVICSAFL